MPSFDTILNATPRVEYFPAYDPYGEMDGISFRGIRALAYDGVDLEGMHTKVFAHIGYPEDAGGTFPENTSCTVPENASGPIPAVVLVHGGGGHPNDKWIRLWNQRGYAAIAMDTTGYFPQSPAPFYSERNIEGLERKLIPPFAEDGYTVAPAKSDMHDGALPVGNQWMYHAVAQVSLAHNSLRADPRIDNAA